MRIGNSIYLDHHATTPVDQRVLAKMLPYFTESFGNPHSVDHGIGWAASRATDAAAAQVARLIRAEPDEIVFTSGATEANNLALLGLAASASSRLTRRLLFSSIDHKSALAVGRVLAQRGFGVTLLPVGADGHLDLDRLEQVLKEGVFVVSLSLVNSEIGTIQKLDEIGRLVRQHGALLHLDAAQAPCAMDLSDAATWADLISLSAHKMYGPKGVGAFYVRRGIQQLLQPIIHGGGQQRDLRSGTTPTPLCVGFGAAVEILLSDDASEERKRIGNLRDLLVRSLREASLPIALNGPEGQDRHPGNANIRFIGLWAHGLLAALQPRLAASTGSACSSGIPEPSHVLRGIGLSAAEAECSIRFCVGRQTTDGDICEAARLITTAASAMAVAGTECV
jgi:cysteine desulfurase